MAPHTPRAWMFCCHVMFSKFNWTLYTPKNRNTNRNGKLHSLKSFMHNTKPKIMVLQCGRYHLYLSLVLCRFLPLVLSVSFVYSFCSSINSQEDFEWSELFLFCLLVLCCSVPFSLSQSVFLLICLFHYYLFYSPHIALRVFSSNSLCECLVTCMLFFALFFIFWWPHFILWSKFKFTEQNCRTKLVMNYNDNCELSTSLFRLTSMTWVSSGRTNTSKWKENWENVQSVPHSKWFHKRGKKLVHMYKNDGIVDVYFRQHYNWDEKDWYLK